MENYFWNHFGDSIITESGVGWNCLVVKYCSDTVYDFAGIDFAPFPDYRIWTVLFWQEEKGEKDGMLCEKNFGHASFSYVYDCLCGWIVYACKSRKYLG